MGPAVAELVEDIAEVGPGVGDTGDLAATKECVENRESLGRFVVAGEEPVFAAESHRAKGVFGGVVVWTQGSVIEEDGQGVPLPQRVGDGATERRFGRGLIGKRVDLHAQSEHQRAREFVAKTLACSGIERILAGLFLDGVDLLDERQRVRGAEVSLFKGQDEFAAQMRQTSGADRSAGSSIQRVESGESVGLQRSVEVFEDLLNRRSLPRRGIDEKDFGIASDGPQVAALDAAGVIPVEDLDSGIIQAQMRAGQSVLADALGDGKKEVEAPRKPSSQRRGGKRYAEPLGKDAALAFERTVIVSLADQDLRKQSRTGQRTVEDTHGGGADDDSGFTSGTGVLMSLDLLDMKPAGYPVEELAGLAADEFLAAATRGAAQLWVGRLTDGVRARKVSWEVATFQLALRASAHRLDGRECGIWDGGVLGGRQQKRRRRSGQSERELRRGNALTLPCVALVEQAVYLLLQARHPLGHGLNEIEQHVHGLRRFARGDTLGTMGPQLRHIELCFARRKGTQRPRHDRYRPFLFVRRKSFRAERCQAKEERVVSRTEAPSADVCALRKV